MAKRRPLTGERRLARKPLKIDRLPIDVHDAIQFLKNHRGNTWQEIEEISALPYNAKWATETGGFVNWESLPIAVLELFPDLKLPHTNLHRWYDLRVRQVTEEAMARSVQAREIAAGFAKSIVKDGDEAVINAARDQIMSVLAEDATPKGRMNAAKALIVLAEVMQEARLNDIKQRQVSVDEGKLKVLLAREALIRKKLEAETDTMAKKQTKGELTVEDINRLRERTFGLPPVKAAPAAHA